MPKAALKPCGQPRCKQLVPRGSRYCKTHLAQARQRDDARRGSSYDRGYDNDWRELRAVFLAEHPLCVMCKAEGRITPASVVDHVKSIGERPDLRLDPSNLRSLCKRHHDERTGRDQAWGRGKIKRK